MAKRTSQPQRRKSNQRARRPSSQHGESPKESESTRDRIAAFVVEQANRGDPPTVREIADAVGLRSPASVQKHLRLLEESGRLVREVDGAARGWRPPRKLDRVDGNLTAGSVKEGKSHGGDSAVQVDESIPVVGRIAAGIPIENGDPSDDSLPFAPAAFARSGEIVALRVEGDSMVDAGVLDGDYAIIRCQRQVEIGEIAAVNLDGEGTLKRWHQKGHRVRLDAANRNYAPLRADLKRQSIEVFGKLVGVVRLNF